MTDLLFYGLADREARRPVRNVVADLPQADLRELRR
jgi:hypothetical protein